MRKEMAAAYFKVISQHSPVNTEGTQQNLPEHTVPLRRLERNAADRWVLPLGFFNEVIAVKFQSDFVRTAPASHWHALQ